MRKGQSFQQMTLRQFGNPLAKNNNNDYYLTSENTCKLIQNES